MKLLLTAIALAAASITAPAFAAEFGVSVTIGEPGFYGQLDMGGYGRPPVIYSRPITVIRGRYGASREPLYLRVPQGHSRDWKRYCGRYDACGRPVYFVRNDWYQNTYAPRYRDNHREGRHDERDYRDNRDYRGERRDNDDRNARNDRDDRDDRDNRGRGGR
jgi:hypothetical protein